MRPTNIKGSLVGIRVKNGRIVGAIFTTGIYRYPYVYISKGEVDWIEALSPDLRLLRFKEGGFSIEKTSDRIKTEKKVYSLHGELPCALKHFDIKGYRVYKADREEDYLIFAPFFPKELIQSIGQYPSLGIPR